MSHRRSLRSTVTTALIAGPLALALVACGSDDDDNDDLATSTQAAATPSPAAEETPAATPAPSDDDSATGGTGNTGNTGGTGDDSTLLAAARTALGSVGGATLFSIDAESTGFDVTLVSGDAAESDVTVAPDGRSVTRGPIAETDDADDVAEDTAERQQLLSDARLDYVAAIEAARAEVQGGTVTGASLDLDNGVATWDVQFDEDTATEQTVTVDAASGDVLGVELDD